MKNRASGLWLTLGGLGALLTCGVASGILAFFLVPRPVEIELLAPIRSSLVICPNATMSMCSDKHAIIGRSVHMNLTIPVQVSNKNFAGIKIDNAILTVMHENLTVGISNPKPVTVPDRYYLIYEVTRLYLCPYALSLPLSYE